MVFHIGPLWEIVTIMWPGTEINLTPLPLAGSRKQWSEILFGSISLTEITHTTKVSVQRLVFNWLHIEWKHADTDQIHDANKLAHMQSSKLMCGKILVIASGDSRPREDAALKQINYIPSMAQSRTQLVHSVLRSV